MSNSVSDLEQNLINRNINTTDSMTLIQINEMLSLSWTDEKEINGRIDALKILIKSLEGLKDKVENERTMLLNKLCSLKNGN